MTTEQSRRTKKAFAHLNSVKPYDGWSTDVYLNSSNQNLVMLKRRNVPISDRGFVELALEKETGCVVGIISHIGVAGKCAYARGVALVGKNGKLIHGAEEKRFTIDKNSGPSDDEQEKELAEVRAEMKQNRNNAKNSIHKRDSIDTTNATDGTSSPTIGRLTDEQNEQLIRLAIGLFVIVPLFRILSSAFFTCFALAIPAACLYAMNTCPRQDTFDAKKELKRVLRGEYMPENHPEKPKNWWSETLTRVQASVTAEVATGLGHEVSFLNIYGICTLVTVNVPAMKLKLYFVGICYKWRYILHMKSEPSREG